MAAETAAKLRAMVMSQLLSPDTEARTAFFELFGADVDVFAASTAKALEKWAAFNNTIAVEDEKRGIVSAVTITAINWHVSSFKLFMSGHTVAAGGLFRQVLESVALALLCSAKGLTVLDRFINDRYSTQKAVDNLIKHQKKVNVKPDVVRALAQAQNVYHKFAHVTKLTIAAGASFSQGTVPIVGAHFDPPKTREYAKEVKARVGFAKVLPSLVDAVEQNVAKW
jgi:3-methyladenine DNA glycosylase AlkD